MEDKKKEGYNQQNKLTQTLDLTLTNLTFYKKALL